MSQHGSEGGLPEDLDPVELQKAFRFAAIASLALVFISIILFPLPLFFTSTIFGEKGLAAWVVVGILWVFGAVFTVVFMPVWESREALGQIFRGIVKVGRPPPPTLVSCAFVC